MNRELQDEIAQLAAVHAEKEMHFQQLAMQNTYGLTDDEQKALSAKYEIARAEYYEAKGKLYDLQRQIAGLQPPANAAMNFMHLHPGFTGYTGTQGDPDFNIFGVPTAKKD